MLVATKAAIAHQKIPIRSIAPTNQATKAIAIDAATPAKVPSKLTAPSVPLSTGFKVVIKNVFLP